MTTTNTERGKLVLKTIGWSFLTMLLIAAEVGVFVAAAIHHPTTWVRWVGLVAAIVMAWRQGQSVGRNSERAKLDTSKTKLERYAKATTGTGLLNGKALLFIAVVNIALMFCLTLWFDYPGAIGIALVVLMASLLLTAMLNHYGKQLSKRLAEEIATGIPGVRARRVVR